jgi:filamentous hemagglutinin family protein
MAGLVLPFSALTKAEVTLDGTLGPASSLTGPNFVIPDTVGQTVGPNLFHSFGLFNINTGESATFTGPPAIDNVISRVTGGSQSFIDGLLSSKIESANLWFINPAGVLFGQHASLDIQGSFHVSTADYLKLGDGGRFEATSPENSVLTVAPPEAFGFLGERQPAGIAVQGSLLQVPDGETLSVVGGDIQIADGSLYAPGGRIDMVSVASPGEVLPHVPDLGVASFERLGRIKVSHSSSSERPQVAPPLPPEVPGNIGNVDVSGEGGGRIFIRGGELVAEDNAFIFANTRGSEEGQGIDIGITGQVTMRNRAGITADTLGPGSGGDVTVEAGSLEMRHGAGIDVRSYLGSRGPGGNVTVTADRIFLSGDGANIEGSPILTGISTSVKGAGNITVTAGNLEVRNGAEISANTFGPGQGGNVTVTADRVFLSGDGANIEGSPILTGILASGSGGGPLGAGSAGNITVTASNLEVRNGAEINADNVTVTAGRVFLSGDGADFPFSTTGIFAVGERFGQPFESRAGNITVTAGNLEVRNGAEISASIFSFGQGGNVLGQGGNVKINATDITLQDGGRISVESLIFAESIGDSTQADAGNITLEVRNLLHLSNDSSITTSARSEGSGGNIAIDSVFVVLDEGSSIIANAEGGPGGNILIHIHGGGALFRSPDSLIEASSEFGVEEDQW